jgi:competence protein ComEC
MAAALAFAWLAQRAPDRVGTVALLAAVAFGGGARGAGHTLRLEREREAIPDGERPWRIEARVVEPPAREAGEPDAVVAVERAEPPMSAGTRLRLRLPRGSSAEWGDRVGLLARIEVPPGARNPGGFDARASAAAGALAASGRAWVCTVRPSHGPAGWPRATVARWRRAIERCLDAHLSGAARELVVPLVIGDRSALPPDLNAAFRASGLVHLLALSGLHVVWLAALARGLCATLGGGVAARAIAGALCAAFYAGIAGPLPSLMRAAATEIVAAVARLRGRALDPIQALSLSALALLAVAPGWAGDLGFQLSCAATLGLVALGPWLTAAAGRWRVVLAPLIPTFAAQVMAMPILLARFHALSWTGALANLIAVPVSGLLLAAAWIGTAADLACPGLGTTLFGACEALAALLRAIATLAGGMPGAMVSAGHDPALVVVAALGATLLAIALPESRGLEARARPVSFARFAARLLGWLAVLVVGLLLAGTRAMAPPPGRAWCVALDVGQGDALALGFADGWWLVDTGPRSPQYDAGERVVLPFLRWAGVRRLEALALTHDDGDHVGGAAAVARGVGLAHRFAPPSYPGLPGPGPRFGARAVARGDTLHRDPLVVALWPPRPVGPAAHPGAGGPAPSLTSADNAAGLVLEVGEGAGRVLLLADVDSTVEESLAIVRGVAALKVAHHGSASSSGTRLLVRTGPCLALLSVGRRNPFGHPAEATLERLEAAGCRIARTDRSGALWLELSRSGVRLIDWRQGAPHGPEAIARPPDARPHE